MKGWDIVLANGIVIVLNAKTYNDAYRFLITSDFKTGKVVYNGDD